MKGCFKTEDGEESGKGSEFESVCVVWVEGRKVDGMGWMSLYYLERRLLRYSRCVLFLFPLYTPSSKISFPL